PAVPAAAAALAGSAASRAGTPWTNSRAQPAATRSPASAGASAAAAAAQQPSTLKAAGRLYDSILAAERKAGRPKHNNNTTEMQCGLSDIQRHSSGGHRTPSPGSQDSADSSRTPPAAATTGGGLTRRRQTRSSGGASRASKDKLLTDSDSRDAGIGDKRNQPKEGSVIGCMNVFADVMKREFVLILKAIAPLSMPGALVCEIEVTRRILNRRVGAHRWVKYLVLPSRARPAQPLTSATAAHGEGVPALQSPQGVPGAGPGGLFVKEFVPGQHPAVLQLPADRRHARDRLGDMRLQTPFGPDPYRPLENTPWKYAGLAPPRNLAVEHTIQHVYPEWGHRVSATAWSRSTKWELAGDYALDLEKRMALERSVRVKNRKLEAEPLFAGEHLKCWWSCLHC
uniref:XRN_M domain-containing protein n=1 Tax=Macrostomum lignano TaxID=282301 RepID=A0A1I8FAK6_9PLAT